MTAAPLSDHPDVLWATIASLADAGDATRPRRQACKEIWQQLDRRARQMGAGQLDTAAVPGRHGTLVLVRGGETLAAAMIRPATVTSVVAYELREELEGLASNADAPR